MILTLGEIIDRDYETWREHSIIYMYLWLDMHHSYANQPGEWSFKYMLGAHAVLMATNDLFAEKFSEPSSRCLYTILR